MSTPAIGQRGLFTFNGDAGQRLMLETMNGTPSWWGYISILNSGGGYVWGTWAGPSNLVDSVMTLPTSGTYMMVVDLVAKGTGSLDVKLHNVEPDLSGSITPGGSSVTVSTTIGQNAALTFSGTAGQRVLLQLFNPTPNWWGYVAIRNASGWSAGTWSAGSNVIDTVTLPATGTYTVTFNPVGGVVGSLTARLYDVPADVTGSLTIGAPPVSVSIPSVGQGARLTFDGTSGQVVTGRITNNTIGTIGLQLLRPDGGQVTWYISSGSSFNMNAATLPTTGVYTLVINPEGVAIGALSIQVTSP